MLTKISLFNHEGGGLLREGYLDRLPDECPFFVKDYAIAKQLEDVESIKKSLLGTGALVRDTNAPSLIRVSP